MTWWQRLFKKKEQEKRLDAELRFHVEYQVSEKIRGGMSEEEARRTTRLEFGGMQSVKEDCRSARSAAWLESTLQDIRYALRSFRKSPAFTIAVIGTLALGIGANTAIFQLLDAVRLRSLPVPNPRELANIRIRGGNPGFGISHDQYQLTYPIWEQTRDHQTAFSGVLAWDLQGVRVGQRAQARRMQALFVNGDFFRTLEVFPSQGRLFAAQDDQAGCATPGVVLSHGIWQSEFGGQASAIGSRLMVFDHPLEILGVTPARFSGLEVGRDFDIAIPICALEVLRSGDQGFKRRDYSWLTVMGRLKSGWTVAQASDHLQAISPAMFEATVPTGYSAKSLERFKKFRLEAVSGATGVSWLRTKYDRSLWLLLGITGLVLLIACANLANLMLARASARQREFAVRLALGASRARLIRHGLCESLLFTVAGAGLGLALAGTLSTTIVSFLGSEASPLHLDLGIDWRMLAFTAGVSLIACLVFGLVPAFQLSQMDPGSTIKSAGRGLTASRERFSIQRLLVVMQISVSLVLLVGALLFVRSFRNLTTLDTGFRQKGILLGYLDFTQLKLSPAALKPFEQEVLNEIRNTPHVDSVATTSNIIVGGGMWSLGVRAGAVADAARFTWVSPDHFKTLETPILNGRDFNANDTEGAPKVAIVNQTFAHRFFGDSDPLGKTFRTAPEPHYPEAEYQVIGVIKDTKYFSIRSVIDPMVYGAADQYPPGRNPWAMMYIRSSAPLGSLGPAIKQRLNASHPAIAMEFHDFRRQIEDGLIAERLMAALSGFFGALAALLATIGLYGVIAYLVVRRRNEIGIRMALGASRRQVIRLVMSEAVLLIAAGVGIGVIGSLALARTASALLFDLKAHDPLTLAAAAVLLATVAALGSYLPAHRASRLDPMAALHYE